MKITLFTDEDPTTSTWLMCDDMRICLEELGHETRIATKMSEIKKTDLLVNNRAQDTIAVLKCRRFTHYERLVTLFASHPQGYFLSQMTMMLASADRWPIVCHSPFMYDTLKDFVSKTFSPSLSRKLQANMVCIPFGVLPVFEDAGTNDKTRWMAPFNRCDETLKQYSKHRELTQTIMASLSMRGETITTRFNAGSAKHSHWEDRDTTGYEVVPQPDTRQEYARQLQQHGIFVSTSLAESFGLMYLEMLLSGMVGVFLDRPWVRRLLPGYPFIASSQDLASMSLAVYNEFERAKKAVAPTVSLVRDQYMLPRFCKALVEYAESVK